MSAEESLDKAEDLLARLEAARARLESTDDPDAAIEEINGRFTQYGVGYQFSKELDCIVKVDSTFMHAEVVNPAIVLLAEKQFEGPAQEFGRARAGCVQASLRAR